MTEPGQPQKSSNKPRVLLIEDDTLLVNMYKTKFENDGYDILTASDGEEGLELALSEKVDIIILDLMLPKLSGTDLLAKLRKDPKGKNVPVVVLTNLTQEGEAKETLTLGVKEYLIKANLTPSQLVEKIKAYIDN